MKNHLYKIALLSLGLWSSTLFAQEPIYEQGKLYVKLYNRFVRGLPLWEELPANSEDLPEVFPSFTSVAQKYGFKRVKQAFKTRDINLDHTYLIEFDRSISIASIQRELERLPYIEYTEPIPVVNSYFLPNDWGQFNDLWHLEKIRAQQAWDITKGSSDVVIAIVDDAIMINHEDLSGNIWENEGEIPNNGFDDDGNGFIDDINGFNVAAGNPNPNPPRDDFAHGTHVAGCASAATDNGIGIPAIGFNCKIMPVRSSSNASVGSQISHAFEGVDYATKAGADIINMSWGFDIRSTVLENLMIAAHNRGIILVAAAGNDNSESLQYPAAFNHVIAVGATTKNDSRSSFSNFGGWVDVSAPGSGILSSVPTGPNGGYDTNDGTSMASPIVAGLLGLMLSVNPCLSPDEAEQILESTTDNIDSQNPNFVGKLGTGRINAEAAVMAAFNAEGSGTPPAPIANFTFDNSSECVNSIPFTFLAPNEGGGSCTFSISYRWKITGDNGFEWNSIEQNPYVEFPETGSYSVSLEVNNSGGMDIQQQTIDISINPKAFIDAGEDLILCQGDSIEIVGNTTADIVSASWAPADGLSNSQELNPVFVAARAGGLYTLQIEGADGCILRDSVQIDVFRNPFVRTLPAIDTLIRMGDTIPLSVADGSGAFAFEWSPIEGLSDPNIANPLAFPDTTTTYSVLGIGEGGCTSQAEITIVVGEPVSNSPLLPDGSRVRGLYPNPARNQLSLHAEMQQAGTLEIELLDLFGKQKEVLFQQNISSGSFEYSWNRPADLASGVYLMRWNWKGHAYVQRVLLK